MHDLRTIRQDWAAFAAAMALRGVDAATVDALAALDVEKRRLEGEAQGLLARRRDNARAVADARRAGDDAAALIAEGRDIGDRLPGAEAAARDAAERLADLVARLPNVARPDVPEGADEAGNLVLKVVGGPATPAWAKPHWEFGPGLGLDAEAGTDLAGARFTVLRGQMARLERALGQFMLDLHVAEHGYEEVAVPHMVREDVLHGTGQLPKFADDLFPAGGGRMLIPTAEVPLTNLVRGRATDPADLPLRLTALTPCYRAEAGAAGRDTRGYMRQHQFMKVELVAITTPEAEADEHERMTRCAETVLERLGLPYRRVLLCTGDMGFAAAKTYDLEVWMPGQGTWREISSVSACGGFQARRMGTRLKGRPDLPATLNGSGVAVGRALAAVLENRLREDGTVEVPRALWPYMGGVERLVPAAQRQG